jgi:GNAT superfamily N-acetyltransferase
MDRNCQIREANREDLPRLLPLLAQLSGDGTRLSLSGAEAVWARMECYPYFRVRLAERGTQATGTYSLLLMDNLAHGAAPTALVENVVVDAAARGQGIGRAMMREAMEIARAHGCYKLVLTSGLARTDAHRFYESLGFARHGHSYLIPLETSDA